MTSPSGSAGAPARVLVCSPALNGRGGMSTAANALLEMAAAHLPGYALEHVATHSATGERTRASAFASIPLTLGAAWRIVTSRPDVVHLFVGARGSLARKSWLATIAHACGCSVVAQPHSGDVDVALTGASVEGVPAERLEKLCRTADALALLRSIEVAPRFASAPVCVVPNPVALQDAPSATERDIDVLYAGRLAPEKGVGLLAEVVAQLVAARPGIQITIAGSAVGEVAERALAEMSVLPQVNAVGWVDESEVVALAKRALILVSPSAVDSLPMSVLTAGACGAWVVATPVGEVPALLADGRGSLVEADAPAWCAEILRALDATDPDAVPGEGLRQIVREDYAPGVVAGALKAAYDTAMLQRAASSHATATGSRGGVVSVPVPVVSIEAIDFLALDERGVVDYALDAVRERRGLRLLTVNVDILQSLKRNPAYRVAVGEDFEAVADGMPIVWASRLMGRPLPGRVTGADLIVSLTGAATLAGMRVLLLGGDAGSAEASRLELARRGAAAEQLVAIELPNPVSFEPAFLAQLASSVEAAQADVVFVSLGSEKGERLISAMRHALPKACWLNVGAAFDFLAGRVERAPGHVQSAGFEWLHRLSREPARLAKRYLVDDGLFALGMLARSAARRLAGGAR